MPPPRSYFPLSGLLALPLLIALLIAASASSHAGHEGAPVPKPFAAQRTTGLHLTAEGVPNFGRVTPTLFRGAQPSARGFERLAQMGIDIVVDTGRSKRDEKLIRNLGMTYISLPWFCPFPKDEIFERFLKLTQDHPGKKIFVHCRLGEDRTGMMIAAYRMGQQGWTAEEAMQEMHEFGFRGAHHLICPGLATYEKSFPQRLQSNPAFAEFGERRK